MPASTTSETRRRSQPKPAKAKATTRPMSSGNVSRPASSLDSHRGKQPRKPRAFIPSMPSPAPPASLPARPGAPPSPRSPPTSPPLPPPPPSVGFGAGEDYIAFDHVQADDDRGDSQHGQPRSDDPNALQDARREPRGRKRTFSAHDREDGYSSKKQRTMAASRKAPWAHDVNWHGCTHVAQMLHREVQAFVNYVSPTPIEDEVRGMVIQIISRAIAREFPDAKVHPFGSYETKLYLPSGDLDLAIESHAMARSGKVDVLRTLALLMRRTGITDKVEVISKAKVPIIKFITSYGRLSVDISVNQLNGVTAGQKILEYANKYPALRALVLVVKCFVAQRSLNEVYTGGLGSYAIVCLVLSFLQMHPKIRRGEIDPSSNLGVLVMDFFELYGHYFNYDAVGICIRGSGSYFSKRERGFFNYDRPFMLCIEDPGDTTNDVAKGSFNIRSVRMAFAGAYESMMAKSYQHAKLLSAIRDHSYVSLHGGYGPEMVAEEMTLLGTVIGVTQELINHRRLLVEVYEKGGLHHILGVPQKKELPPPAFHGQRSENPTSQSGVAAANSVRSAWGEADMDISDVEGDCRDVRQDSDEEAGRYDIGAPVRKRPRHSLHGQTHTVFVADDDEAGESGDSGTANESHEEEDLNVYELEVKDRPPRSSRDRNRNYWLSKGSVMGSALDDSE